MTPGPRFEEALLWATHLHRDQLRKGTTVPYVAHLLAVASLVMEDGGDEEEAIAALLHDAIEDQGVTVSEIEARFGHRVAVIVDACTDTDVRPKPPWRDRKEAYLDHLRNPDASPGALRVSAADKVHNARSILTDLRIHGDEVWRRFNAGRDEVLWYYREVASILAARAPGRLATELSIVVEDLVQGAER